MSVNIIILKLLEDNDWIKYKVHNTFGDIKEEKFL